MALVNGRSKLAKILAEEGRWRRSPATAHQDSLAETGKLRTLREGTESSVFVQYGAQGPRPTITMLTGRSGAANDVVKELLHSLLGGFQKNCLQLFQDTWIFKILEKWS